MKRTLILIFLTFSACGTGKNNLVSESITLERTEMVLSHDGLQLSSPVDLEKVVGKDSLLIFDRGSNSIVLFDLNSKEVLRSITLQTEGPDFADFPLYDFSIHKNRVMLLSQSYFSVYNLDGMVIYRLGKDEIPGLNSDFNLWNFFVSDHETVFFPVLLYGAITPGKQDIEDASIVIELDLKTHETKKLDITYPKEALVSDETRGFYNSHAKHHILAHHNYLVYHFEFSSKIYRYDLNNSALDVFPAMSSNTQNIRESVPANYSLEELTSAYYSGPRFYMLHYDKLTKHYARLHFEYLNDTNGNNVMRSYLMLFNEEFEVVKELALEEGHSVNMFVNDGKIYFWKSYFETSVEDGYEVFVYSIKQN